MPKGYFTAAAVVLMERTPAIAEMQNALQRFPVQGVQQAPNPGWMGAAQSLVISLGQEPRGKILVDAIGLPWPDGMGDPQADPNLFAAWSMGFMGPFTFPGGLQRAVQHAVAWPEAGAAVARHRSIIRVRATYAVGASDNDPVIPDGYNALQELEWVTSAARALLYLPGALCYFNPNGETLHTGPQLDEILQYHAQAQLPPFQAWSNVRRFDAGGGWTMMDTVGMGQADMEDHEVCFITQRMDAGEMDNFLRNTTLYILRNGPIIKDRDTMGGPNGTNWQARMCGEALCQPPRRTLRWFPYDGSVPPANLQPA